MRPNTQRSLPNVLSLEPLDTLYPSSPPGARACILVTNVSITHPATHKQKRRPQAEAAAPVVQTLGVDEESKTGASLYVDRSTDFQLMNLITRL